MNLKLRNAKLFREEAHLNGIWKADINDKRFDVRNPATQEVIARVSDHGSEVTEEAIDSAKAAFIIWSDKPAQERARILRNWYDIIVENAHDLAQILTLEQGKPLKEAKGEVLYGASFVEWYAEEAKRIYGDVIPSPSQDKRIVVIKQPIGVVAAITPWNFPVAMITRKVAPALAAGCTAVIKPSEETPLSALALAELALEAGFPPGVLNVITGLNAKEIGETLTGNEAIKKVSFTGSTPVGKLLMKQCADSVKKVSLELGGNAPFIVFNDADIDAAVEGAIASKYRNAGQTCVCANRIIVQQDVYDEFAHKYAEKVALMKVGHGREENVEIGPLINEKAIEKVERLVADALKKGARTLTGGKRHEKGGTYYQPTVLLDVNETMSCAQEEIFGPVAPLFKFSEEREAIDLANNTPYGLASYFYSRDIGRIWRVAEGLEYGIVGINEGLISTAVAPFGGVKESGIGREGSKYGIDDYVEIKYLCMGGL